MDLTLYEAAAYLAERGYTVGRRRVGGRGPIAAATLRAWCWSGKIACRKASPQVWLVKQEDLDRLLAEQTAARSLAARMEESHEI